MAGCKPSAAPASQGPKAVVTVSRPLDREVVEWDEYSGHVDVPGFVNVEAQVSGQIVDTPFEEGAIVHKGDLLFAIDPRPFKADLDAKQAVVKNAEAQVQVNQITLSRIETAQPGAAVSQQEHDTAIANVKVAQAVFSAAQAAVMASQLNVEWSRVVAPIDGRVSRKNVTVGNLVTGGTGQGTLLTTIASIDPVYLYVDVDENSILKYQRLAAEKKRVSARDQHIPCFMQLQNEKDFPHAGVVDFVNNSLDPQTGTLRCRGVFPNPQKTLLPGMSATLRIAGSGRYRTLLIPAAAVQTQQSLKYVLAVDDKGVVASKTVQPGASFGDLQSIVSGIAPTDRVIVNGMLRARPGAAVDAKEQPIDSSSFEMTSPGSPTTQDLPVTRPFSGPPGAGIPPASSIVPATTAPASQPGAAR